MFSNRLTFLFELLPSLFFISLQNQKKKKNTKVIFLLTKIKIVWSFKNQIIFICAIVITSSQFFIFFLFFYTSAQIVSSGTSFPFSVPFFVVSYNRSDAICHYVFESSNSVNHYNLFRLLILNYGLIVFTLTYLSAEQEWMICNNRNYSLSHNHK